MSASLITIGIQPDRNDFIKVWFVQNEAGLKTRQQAYKVSDWILVSYFGDVYKLYRADNGKPLLPVSFVNPVDALTIAAWISHIYEEYFSIWESDPKINLFSIVKWSVKNGVEIYELLHLLPPKVESLDVLNEVQHSKRFQERVKYWYGGLTRAAS